MNAYVRWRNISEVIIMVEFLLCVAQYVLIALVLLGIGGIGAFIGIKMRKSSDAKAAAEAAEEAMETEE